MFECFLHYCFPRSFFCSASKASMKWISTGESWYWVRSWKCKAINHILLQHLSGPLTELHASMRIDTIPDTDNHVEVIVRNGVSFPIGRSCCIFCNNWISLYLTTFKYILYMSWNGRLIALKQLRHLVGSKPHGFIGKTNLNLSLASLRLSIISKL